MAKTLTEMAADITTAQASHTTMSAEEIENFLKRTFQALQTVKNIEEGEGSDVQESAEPEMDPKKSILRNKVICLECGKEFKILTNRHLQKEHQMDAKEYRRKYGFSSRQSLAAKSLSAQRRATAKKHKLGEKLQQGKAQKKK